MSEAFSVGLIIGVILGAIILCILVAIIAVSIRLRRERRRTLKLSLLPPPVQADSPPAYDSHHRVPPMPHIQSPSTGPSSPVESPVVGTATLLQIRNINGSDSGFSIVCGDENTLSRPQSAVKDWSLVFVNSSDHHASILCVIAGLRGTFTKSHNPDILLGLNPMTSKVGEHGKKDLSASLFQNGPSTDSIYVRKSIPQDVCYRLNICISLEPEVDGRLDKKLVVLVTDLTYFAHLWAISKSNRRLFSPQSNLPHLRLSYPQVTYDKISSFALPTLRRSTGMEKLRVLHASVKPFAHLLHAPMQSLRGHIHRISSPKAGSIMHHARRYSACHDLYEMLATAKELGESPGFPGTHTTKFTAKPTYQKNITDTDGNHFNSDVFAALWFKKVITDSDGNHFNPAIFRFVPSSFQESSIERSKSFHCATASTTSSSRVDSSVEKYVGETWKSDFGAARDAEEAAKYYV